MWGCRVNSVFSGIRGSLGFSAITAYYHDLALFIPFLPTVRYVFDRRFYNDSDLPRSIRVPQYFKIKVIRETFDVFDERKRRIGIPGTELLSFFSGYKKMKFKRYEANGCKALFRCQCELAVVGRICDRRNL